MKKIELHHAFKKENRNYLSDIYYDESQMNKWRDSCVRTQDCCRSKLEKLHREMHTFRNKISAATPTGLLPDEKKLKLLKDQLEQLL